MGVFRQWLVRHFGQDHAVIEYRDLLSRLSYAQPGRRFSRDEANER